MKEFFAFLIASFTAISGFFFSGGKTTPSQFIQDTSTPSASESIQISKGANPAIKFTLPSGYTIHVFAQNLGSARDLAFSPNGTLLVSNPTKNQVIALPDRNNDGVADENKVVITNEPYVHGLAFYQNHLFIADTTKVVRYNWDESQITATKDKDLFTLPANNDHNSRTLAIDSAGIMYISVGSTCDACSEAPTQGGSVWKSDTNGTKPTIFATGLRNASFIVFNPTTNALWGTEMGRDNLGDNIPPDEINIIESGKNYGWPNCYGNNVLDTNFVKSKSVNCSADTPPIFEIPAHSAPLGLTFIQGSQFTNWQGDLLVSYHGSWNRSTPTGYKVVHMKISGNTITSVDDFITGFAPTSTPNTPGNEVNTAQGRPVDLIFDKNGNLYLSDDKAGVVYIIQKQ